MLPQSSHIILIIRMPSSWFKDQSRLEVIVLSKSKKRKERDSNISIPEPEITKDKKLKCPLDQTIHDNRNDYNRHCKEEHDVL
jgi:hypothetical protein